MPVEKLKMMAVNNRYKTRPDLFSRVSLELTFRLLRNQNARLALEVQNLLQGEKAEPLALPSHPSASHFLGDLQGDHFYVTLSPQNVGKVVDVLTQLGQDLLNNSTPSNKRLIICTLIKDWICLAEWLLLQAERPAHTYH
jgi:hypothetical protein